MPSEPLTKLLADEEPDVRQMAAFALGLIGDPAARPALQTALGDANPLVQGRAAEALGMIGNRADADAVSAMVRTHVAAGALAGIDADDLTYPQTPPAEAVRLGLYALVRLGSYEALAAAALDAKYQPVSTWWPVAYAIQRLPRPAQRAGAADAAEHAGPVHRGLCRARARRHQGRGRRDAATRRSSSDAARHPAVVIQALRALAAMNDTARRQPSMPIVVDAKADPTLRLEAMTALSGLVGPESLDLMLDLVSDRSPDDPRVCHPDAGADRPRCAADDLVRA